MFFPLPRFFFSFFFFGMYLAFLFIRPTRECTQLHCSTFPHYLLLWEMYARRGVCKLGPMRQCLVLNGDCGGEFSLSNLSPPPPPPLPPLWSSEIFPLHLTVSLFAGELAVEAGEGDTKGLKKEKRNCFMIFFYFSGKITKSVIKCTEMVFFLTCSAHIGYL